MGGKLPLETQFLHFHQGEKGFPIQSWTLEFKTNLVIFELDNKKRRRMNWNTNLIPGFNLPRYSWLPPFPLSLLFLMGDFLLYYFYRIKEGKMGRELRIADFLDNQGSITTRKKESEKIEEDWKMGESSIYPLFPAWKLYYWKNIGIWGILPIVPMGPIVTLRASQSCIKSHWISIANGSLGDLEVFWSVSGAAVGVSGVGSGFVGCRFRHGGQVSVSPRRTG